MNATARDEVPDSMPADGSEAASLVESAMLLRWRAPELALLLANRAVAAAGDHRPTVLRAEQLAVFALNRLERPSEAAYRLLAALRDANVPVELRHELHVELAHCAAALGQPGIALAALRPVLATGDDIAPVLRGMALIGTAESAGVLGRGDVVTKALAEADELFREEPQLDRDTALLLRATAKAVDAMRHRRSGAPAESEAQARAGRELLAGLADPEHDSGQVSGRLTLELVLALLDRGEGDAAAWEARPLLRRPVRAAAAGAVGWLRLALATRVHLAEGRHEPALALLADAVEVAQRHGVDAVLAECLEGLSHVHEVRGEFADALHCLRSARAAESRYRRTAEMARSALIEHCDVRHQEIPALVDQIAALLSGTGWLRAVPDPDTGLLDTEEYGGRVEAALDEPAPLSQVLVATGSAVDEPPGRGLLIELSRRLRAAAPGGAEFGQVTGDLTAVLLPAMGRVQAQAWADRFRVRSAAELGVEIIVGVAQHRAGTGADQFLADTVLALRNAANDTQVTGRRPDGSRGRTAAEPVTVILSVVPAATDHSGSTNGRPTAKPARAGMHVGPSAPDPRASEELLAAHPVVQDQDVRRPKQWPEPPHIDEPVSQPAGPADAEPAAASESALPPGAHRRRSTNGTPVLVSDLLSRSVLSAGRSGRRRAEDRADDRPQDQADGISVAEVSPPPSGPPPPPPPRNLEWASNGSGGDMDSVGMGDLLAEALAAFQEGATPLREGIDVTGPSVAVTGDSLDPAPRRDRTPSLQLADDQVDRHPGSAREAMTDPELRLPDLTAEPLWRPPGMNRQSAAGD
ncbi:MAG: hypothetical protein ACRDSP_16710 [Pseudonocardiaceae bacterium]